MNKETNTVIISGVLSEVKKSHHVYGEEFYEGMVSVPRSSGAIDTIPVLISERLINPVECEGKSIQVFGQFRSYNRHEGDKNRLVLSVFAREVSFVEEGNEKVKSNQIFLDGYICKPPVYRETPFGREIADMLLAVNRSYGKSDYIPCICWGRNARFADGIEVGTHIKITGRIQSREYRKRISEDEYETKTAYEVSISKLEVIDGEECKDQVADAE